MRPAIGQLQGLATHPLGGAQGGVAATGVDLDGAVEPVEDFGGIGAAPPGAIMEH